MGLPLGFKTPPKTRSVVKQSAIYIDSQMCSTLSPEINLDISASLHMHPAYVGPEGPHIMIPRGPFGVFMGPVGEIAMRGVIIGSGRNSYEYRIVFVFFDR